METKEISNNKKSEINIQDFGEVLVKFGLDYKTDDYFHSVSFGRAEEYKVISISIIQSQLREFSKVLLPFLIKERLSFRLVKNSEVALWILNGLLSYDFIGKTIMIYLPSTYDFNKTTQELVALTEGFKGPEIPCDFHIGGCVYLMLEEGKTVQKTRPKKFHLFKNKYMLAQVLKPDPKGDVWEGTFINGLFGSRKCIIKEGRKFMWSDAAGRDMKDRLQWQQHIHQKLSGEINIPEILDLFENQGNTYLVTEFIKGKTLEQAVNEMYEKENWISFSYSRRIKLLNIVLDVLKMLEKMHESGYVHRDLNPANFILTTRDKLYIIDMELVYCRSTTYPLPVFGLGTPGFMSPEQVSGQIPTEKEDIYGLGALMTILFAGLKTVDPVLSAEQIQSSVYISTQEPQLGYLIKKCLSKFPEERPDLEEITQVIQHVKQTSSLKF